MASDIKYDAIIRHSSFLVEGSIDESEYLPSPKIMNTKDET